MDVNEIMSRMYDVLVMFDLVPYLRAMIIIAVSTSLLRWLFFRS